ncbi:MAG: 8-oxo-dGTP diphosphatase [Candidatus Bathyarchaeota archaeon]
MIRATICEIIKDDKLLLQHKAAGKFGEGKWNGPGGKLKPDETPEEGVIREVREETGLTVLDPRLNGLIDFYFGEKTEPDWSTYIFRVTEYTGELNANDEGELRWFSFKDIPYTQMWQDDQHWLPAFLEGKKVKGAFWFNTDGAELIRHELRIE